MSTTGGQMFFGKRRPLDEKACQSMLAGKECAG